MLVIDALLWSALVGAAWLGLFLVVPWCLRSLYRYKLWALRDALSDDVRKGALPEDHPVMRRLVELVDGGIVYSNALTAANMLLMTLMLRGQPAAGVELKGEDLTEMQREILGRYRHEFNVATGQHVLLGSPSGWLLLGPSIVALGLWRLTGARRGIDRAIKSAERTIDEKNHHGGGGMALPNMV